MVMQSQRNMLTLSSVSNDGRGLKPLVAQAVGVFDVPFVRQQ